MKECKYCNQENRDDAIECKYCSKVFPDVQVDPEAPIQTRQKKYKKCPYCAEKIRFEAIYCRYCEKDLVGATNELLLINSSNQGANNQPHVKNGEQQQIPQSFTHELFSCNGRISKLRFLRTSAELSLGIGLLYYLLTLIVNVESQFMIIFGIVSLLFYLVLIECQVIKRFHDLDKSGWYSILAFIPVVNIVIGWILILKVGTKGKNRYGEEPG